MLFGQIINGPNGMVAIHRCKTREDAVSNAVDLAIISGWHPPRWWQFWLPKWPADCRTEYERRQKGT